MKKAKAVIMKHVKVTFKNNDTIETPINGTVKEIIKYYKIGKLFNLGTLNDNVQAVTKLEFLA